MKEKKQKSVDQSYQRLLPTYFRFHVIGITLLLVPSLLVGIL